MEDDLADISLNVECMTVCDVTIGGVECEMFVNIVKHALCAQLEKETLVLVDSLFNGW